MTLADSRLLSVVWDGHTAGALAHRCGVPHLELLHETDSTQDVAHELADGGAPPGTVVLSDTQRAGRGRHGRSWSSQPGRGVWCTILERPSEHRALDVLSIRVGLRVAEALDEFAETRIGLKWPNDLVVPDGKLGGVLTEARWSGASLGWVAIGIGINVLPPLGIPGAAGLRDGVRRADVLAAVVRAVRGAAACGGYLSSQELERYHARDVLLNRRIAAPAAGTVAGISMNGSLVVETADGPAELRTGTVRYAGET
jgi:BirA family biotin operon repressor/biotin-[acetyl-CoA-carboxylase] ligase